VGEKSRQELGGLSTEEEDTDVITQIDSINEKHMPAGDCISNCEPECLNL